MSGRTRRYVASCAVIAAGALALGWLVPAGTAPAGAAPVGGPELSPVDGTTISGSRAVLARPAGDDPVASLVVGDDVAGVPTLGEGSVDLVFEGRSVEATYSNYLVVNGEPVAIDAHHPPAEFAELTVEIDQHLLIDGSNTIRFVTGTRKTGCGVNRDDMQLRNLSLRFDDGAEVELSAGEVIALGDGSCGSNTSKPLFVDLPVELDREPVGPAAMLAPLDLATLGEGPLTVRAESASGAVSEATYLVDTAGPELVSSVPAEGQSVTGEVTVGADLGDPSGVEPPVEFRLDGAWIDEGASIAADALDQGEHLLEITARDGVGNMAVHEVAFTSQRSAENPQGPILSVTDGDVLSAEEYVLASAVPDDAVRELRIDGEPVEALPTLGEGSATLTIEGSDLEPPYGNYLVVNGTRLPVDVRTVRGPEFEFFEVEIPNHALVTGPNEVRLAAGTVEASCGTNYDDFQVRNISLKLSDGSVVEIAGSEAIAIGDGRCGSNAAKPTSVEFSFDVAVAAESDPGLLARIDTRSRDDGSVDIVAESMAGVTHATEVTIDNTAPELLASTPPDGSTVAGTIEPEVRLWDLTGLEAEPTARLDGEEVALGQPISVTELEPGAHELEVSAADVAGNPATYQIAFSTTAALPPEQPDELAPATGSTGQPTSVELSAAVEDPAGGTLSATFYEGQRVRPVAGYEGVAQSLSPDQLEVPGQRAVDVEDLGEAELVSPEATGVSFQQFDLPVEDVEDEQHQVAWSGWMDPARAVSLHAWDVVVGEWFELDSARGEADGPVRLSSTVNDRFIDDDVVHVRVEGHDPFADDIDDEPDAAFRDPSTYDFALAHLSDTQYLSEGAVSGATAEVQDRFADGYLGLAQWIVDNAEERKIEYVAHTGDLIESNLWNGTDAYRAEARAEYEFASQAQRVLEHAGIPNGVLAGNHDNQNAGDPHATLYNEFFGPTRYEQASAEASQDYYRGPWREGDNQNHHDVFSAGGLDFVAVYLGYGITEAELEWAGGVLERYSDRNAIVLSHAYLSPSSEPDGRGGGLSQPDGSVVVDLIEDHANVVLALSGHETGVNIRVRSDVGDGDNDVVEMLTDYQGYVVDGHRLGASYLRLLQFDVDRGEMTVDTYSPSLDDFGAREYDMVEGRYGAAADEFTVPVALTSRQTSFTTTDIALVVRSDAAIGQTEVESGTTAVVTWADLSPVSDYGWYVDVENSEGLRTQSGVAEFSTGAESPSGVPGQGVLSTTSGWAYGLADGNYTVIMNLWSGQSADQIRVYENGELLASSSVPDSAPAAQEFSVDVTGRHNGTYTYTCELENVHGVSECAPVTVQVTDAEPGRAVLSSDNWDGDGQFTVVANLWWGTNATEYRLYEDGDLIDTQALTAHTPDAQSARTEISDREPGVHRYVAELVNDAGSTRTEPIEVSVE